MRINTNVAALQAQQNLGRTNAAAQSSMAKLSSGFRIVRAGDDAAGLSIANSLRTNVRSLTQASRNVEQAQSVLSVAEGAASSVEKILERMKELAVQAATDTNESQRTTLNNEFTALKQEITRIAENTEFQGAKLIDGSFNGKTLQIGAGNSAQEQLSIDIGDLKAVQLGLQSMDLTSRANAQAAMTAIDGREGDVHTAGTAHLTLEAGDDSTLTIDGTTYTVTAGTDMSREQVAAAFNALSGGAFNVSVAESGVFVLTTEAGAVVSSGGDVDFFDSLTVEAGVVGGGALNQVNGELSKIGAMQNRLDYAQENLRTAIINTSAAESVIRDVDMAEEMTKFSKQQILQQAGTAMLAQANQSSQAVLQLLRG